MKIFVPGQNLLVTASISCRYANQTPTHVPLALSGYATTESVLFGSAGESRVREGASEMVAYRAGRVPRYYVDCPVMQDRATPSRTPLKRSETPSSIG